MSPFESSYPDDVAIVEQHASRQRSKWYGQSGCSCAPCSRARQMGYIPQAHAYLVRHVMASRPTVPKTC